MSPVGSGMRCRAIMSCWVRAGSPELLAIRFLLVNFGDSAEIANFIGVLGKQPALFFHGVRVPPLLDFDRV